MEAGYVVCIKMRDVGSMLGPGCNTRMCADTYCLPHILGRGSQVQAFLSWVPHAARQYVHVQQHCRVFAWTLSLLLADLHMYSASEIPSCAYTTLH